MRDRADRLVLAVEEAVEAAPEEPAVEEAVEVAADEEATVLETPAIVEEIASAGDEETKEEAE